MNGSAPAAGPVPPFFLIRHGETNWNLEGRLQGQTDIPLNPVGRDQASAAGRSLKHLLTRAGIADPSALDYVASPLGRATHTMELVRQSLDLPIAGFRTDDRLKELAFGDWEGLTWNELKARDRPVVRERKRDKYNFVPPGGESYAQLGERLRPWVATLKPQSVVVAHGGVARVLMVLLAGVLPDAAPGIDIWQGRVMIFARGGMRWD